MGLRGFFFLGLDCVFVSRFFFGRRCNEIFRDGLTFFAALSSFSIRKMLTKKKQNVDDFFVGFYFRA